MSDTPLTDKHCDFGNVGRNGERIIVTTVPAEFSRTLERDLAQARAALDARWLPIESAPKDIVNESHGHEFGPPILVVTHYREVVRARWWRFRESSNFIADGNLAVVNPTHWMPLPEPPASSAEEARG